MSIDIDLLNEAELIDLNQVGSWRGCGSCVSSRPMKACSSSGSGSG
jgi:hypothetical protein